MLRRLNVSTKVRAVLAVPMIVLLVAGAYIGWGSYDQLQAARTNAAVVQALADFQNVANALRTEQAASEGVVDSAELAKARAATDQAIVEFRDTADRVDPGALPEKSGTAFTDMVEALDSTLASARNQADNGTGLVTSTYQSIFTKQLTFVQVWSNETTDRPLAAWVAVHGDLLGLVNSMMAEHRAAQELFSLGLDTVRKDTYLAAAGATNNAKITAGASIDIQGLDGGQVRAWGPTLSKMRSDLTAGAVGSVDPAAWAEGVNEQLATVDATDRTILEEASGAAADRSRAALVASLITLAVLLLAGVAAWLIASIVARSIVRPLRRLTETAGDVREQLPRIVEQVAVPGEGPDIELPRIPVESDDELGRLASAFNDVNATTIQVAQEQAALRGSIAEMFVNVARRDQVLLNRQLAFVDSLERSEEDPTVLANLFHLDHLATRMRRNAESLLVLAGIDSGRRLRESMPLSDVIRTASSEIEQYDRVELDLNVDPLMLGFNALPAAHLLAEILENASVFSEPDTPVEVSTGLQGQFVTVHVLDHGIGMTEPEIEAVNDKLRSTSPGDALGAQRLGLFVVARLARRLGAEVEIHRSPVGPGTQTEVRFPVALFAGLEPQPSGYDQMETTAPGASDQAFIMAPPAMSEDLALAFEAQEVPLADEINLGALTEGTTNRGLPKRRVPGHEDVDSGAFVLPPAVQAHQLPQDLAGPATGGFTPTIMSASATTGLPSRRRDAEPEIQEIPPLDLSTPAPVDPESRAGLFTGFRGWSRTQSETEEPSQRPSPFGRQPSQLSDFGSSYAEPSYSQPSYADAGYDESTDAGYPVPEYSEEYSAEAETYVVQPEDETPVVPRPRRGRGAHVAGDRPPADLPFGHTKDEVAGWHSGPIPIVDPGDDSDWPSPTWDTASWQPAGLFTRQPGEEGPLVPAFDPVALEPEIDPYQPAAFQAGGPMGDVRQYEHEYPTGLENATPGQWDEPEAEWQPVMDLSTAPLSGGRTDDSQDGGTDWSWSEPDSTPASSGSEPQWAGSDGNGGWSESNEGQWSQPHAPNGQWSAPAQEPWSPESEADQGWEGAPDQAWPAESSSEGQWAPDPAQQNVAWSEPDPVQDWAASVGANNSADPDPVQDWAASVGANNSADPDLWPSSMDDGQAKPKRKFGLFGRKAKESPSVPTPAAPVSQPSPAVNAPAPSASWEPTEQPTPTAAWSPEPAYSPPPAQYEPAQVSQPAERTKLEDNVASMLALRSDIEEQALAELSQLSAYRPSMGGSSERLTRRVPSEMPDVAPAASGAPSRRDPDELRSRLASFQSGTSRGRRASTDTKERDA